MNFFSGSRYFFNATRDSSCKFCLKNAINSICPSQDEKPSKLNSNGVVVVVDGKNDDL